MGLEPVFTKLSSGSRAVLSSPSPLRTGRARFPRIRLKPVKRPLRDAVSLRIRFSVTRLVARDLPLNEWVSQRRLTHSMDQIRGTGHPLYVSREDHVKGMIRLLALGLRLLGLLEFAVRRRLSELCDPVTGASAPLLGLYAGNPKRATLQPTAESLLKAFKEISLTLVNHSCQVLRHVTALTLLQQRILELLDSVPEVYTRLLDQSVLPPLKMSEP